MTLVKSAVAVALVALVSLAPAAVHADSRTEVASPLETDVYRVWFDAGTHTVTVRGDGSTNLDLYVYGASGLIVSDEGPTDKCMVHFRVTRSGYFFVKIVNRGLLFNHYTLWTD
jgi:hypothetical protein